MERTGGVTRAGRARADVLYQPPRRRVVVFVLPRQSANPGRQACQHRQAHRSAGAGRHPRAFTDSAKVDKWFRRNCKDVLQRECAPGEKADVLAYLLSLKP